ncbi:hypothetical protein BDD12DRAFT_838157 [Trichophaea hybrida]|nr:hypothetical protein BDD12DRAFT_838157 [Trichophaea hybrida]
MQTQYTKRPTLPLTSKFRPPHPFQTHHCDVAFESPSTRELPPSRCRSQGIDSRIESRGLQLFENSLNTL